MDDYFDRVPPLGPLNAAQRRFLRRSASRLVSALRVARRSECECDEYVGFTCGKHQRVHDLEVALAIRHGVSLTALDKHIDL